MNEVYNVDIDESNVKLDKKFLVNNNLLDKIRGLVIMNILPLISRSKQKQGSKKSIDKSELYSNKKKKNSQIGNMIKSIFTVETNTFSMSFKDYINYFFNPNKSHQKKIIDTGIKKIEELLDIVHVSNKLLEIDKIKYLLLNENQLNLFDYLPKPKISTILKENKLLLNKFSEIPEKDQKLIEKAMIAKNSFIEIKNQKSLSNIDEKLLKLIDKNLIEILNVEKQKNYKNILNIDIPQEVKSSDNRKIN